MLQLRRGGHLCCSNRPPHSCRPGIVWPQSFPPRKATHPWGRSIPQETLVQGKKAFLSFLVSSPHSATDSHCDLGQLWSLQGDLQLYSTIPAVCCAEYANVFHNLFPIPQCVAVNCNLPSYLTDWLGRNSAAFEKISNLGAKLKKQKRKKKLLKLLKAAVLKKINEIDFSLHTSEADFLGVFWCVHEHQKSGCCFK